MSSKYDSRYKGKYIPLSLFSIKKVFFLQVVYILFVNVVFSQIQLPSQIQLSSSPGDSAPPQQTLTMRVIVLRDENEQDTNLGENQESEALNGIINFFPEEMRNGTYIKILDEKRDIPVEIDRELIWDISRVTKLNVRLLNIDYNSQLVELESDLQTEREGVSVSVVKATGKVKIGGYLFYANLEFDGSVNHLILSISKGDDNGQSQNKEQNQENTPEDKSEGESESEGKIENEDEKNKSESDKNNSDGESKGENGSEDKKDEQSNEQLMLLLKSLEDIDKKEQKEMLNRRERIELLEEWW